MFKYFINIGVSELNNEHLNRKIRVSNLIASIIIVSMVGYISIDLKLNIPTILYLNTAFLCFALLSFFLNSKGHHQLAFHILSSYCVLQFLLSTIFYGLAANIHFFQLVIALTIIVLFDKKIVQHIYLAVILTCFFAAVIIMANKPGLVPFTDEIKKILLTFNLVNLFIFFLSVMIFFVFFKWDNLNFQKAIIGQTKIIEHQQQELVASINYAKRIQTSLLPDKSLFEKNLPDHFLIFKPKEVVSGDFYWTAIKQNRFFLAVCDSKAHGVPGAFMSLLNVGLLSEAVNSTEIIQPHEVFNYVRDGIVKIMERGKQLAGMEGVLLCLDKSSGTVTYASANNSPLLIRQKLLTNLPKDEIKISTDRKNDPFVLHTISLQKGDCLYLYTNGYADQFGGPAGKKYMHRGFEKLLVENSEKPMNAQAAVLDKVFEDWKGLTEQVDDVLIIGIKF